MAPISDSEGTARSQAADWGLGERASLTLEVLPVAPFGAMARSRSRNIW